MRRPPRLLPRPRPTPAPRGTIPAANAPSAGPRSVESWRSWDGLRDRPGRPGSPVRGAGRRPEGFPSRRRRAAEGILIIVPGGVRRSS